MSRRPFALAARGLLLGLAFLCAGASPAAAQSGERIRSFAVEVVVESDATLRVTEHIRYDFGSQERHGIIREIPVRFNYEQDNRYEQLTEIDQIEVDAPLGTPDGLEIKEEGRLKRLRIGDPDKTITGARDYTITYRVRGAITAYSEHDELKWNATGNFWPVPIEATTVQVRTPGPVTQVACFQGVTGSLLQCGTANVDGSGATFSHGGLGPQEGVTVVVGMVKGAVTVPPPILDERWSASRAFAVTPLSVGLTAAVGALTALGLVKVLGKGRDRRYAGSPVDVAFGNVSGTEEAVPLLGRPQDPVEFEPPDRIRPGQVGTLIDEVANPLDVTATIVDLAVRGYLSIEEIPKKGWFGKPDWRLTKLKESERLLAYERRLLDGIFETDDTVELSELKTKFATRLGKVQDALYDDAVAAGWFTVRPDKVRTKWTVLAVVALVLAVIVAIGLAAATHLGLVGLPLVVGAVVLLAGAKRIPRRTPKGWATLRRVTGFRRFIEESEKDRAQFAERANLFSEYLPYAVVFGCTEKWARAFAGLDTEIAATTSAWYVSSQPFSVGHFSDSMDGFAVTTAGTIAASAPSSSSGFSGGGGSGGGFGGGGGGSW